MESLKGWLLNEVKITGNNEEEASEIAKLLVKGKMNLLLLDFNETIKKAKWLQLILFSKRQTSVSIFCERPLTVKKGQFFDVNYWSVLIELSVKRYIQKRNQNGGWRIWSLWMYIQSWNGNEKITVSIETISILLHRKWMSTGTYL